MSRAYKLEVYVKGITPDDLGKCMKEQLFWEEISISEYKGIACFTGEGWLSGGQAEQEAHEVIYKILKAINPQALISTRWTCMEELPYSDYGDDFDVNTPLEPHKESGSPEKQN